MLLIILYDLSGIQVSYALLQASSATHAKLRMGYKMLPHQSKIKLFVKSFILCLTSHLTPILDRQLLRFTL